MKTIYILLYLGDYYDEFKSLEEAETVKNSYNSWFSDNCEIKKQNIKLY